MTTNRVTTEQVGHTHIKRIDGQVPHTVLSLPSGRTMAYGKSPHPTSGNKPDITVNSAIQILVDFENLAQGGRGSRQNQARALERLDEVAASLEHYCEGEGMATKALQDDATWARVVLGHARRLVASLPTSD